VNPVSLVRWYYLDWYSGWQTYNEASVVFSLREGIPNLHGLLHPRQWVAWGSQ